MAAAGAAAAAAAGGSDRCREGRTRRRSGGGRSAGTSSGRVTGWGKWLSRRRPCPSCAIGNSLRSPPWCRCPPVAETEPLAGRAGGAMAVSRRLANRSLPPGRARRGVRGDGGCASTCPRWGSPAPEEAAVPAPLPPPARGGRGAGASGRRETFRLPSPGLAGRSEVPGRGILGLWAPRARLLRGCRGRRVVVRGREAAAKRDRSS